VSSAPADTPAGLRIDGATEADVPLLLALIKELAEYERLADQVVATEVRMRESLFSEPRAAEAVIARVGDDPVGYALWFYTYSTFLGRRGLYLEDLFVKPAWRGKGIGRALLAHLAGEAVARDCGRLEWSVLDWNEPAIGFYKGLGARPMDEWTVFRLSDQALNRLAERKNQR
jgi:GNAT superfamily N-acetyltransferase